jgi:hypothetical protein
VITRLDDEDVQRIARAVVAELRAGEMPGMVDQASSPIGRRRHIAAVRRRVAAGAAGASVVGRRYLLAREWVDAELASLAKRAPKAKGQPVDDLADLRAQYGLTRRAS